MTVIPVNAPEGHLWHGQTVHVCGAASHTILTSYGTFTWNARQEGWVWICEADVSLIWPDPSSPAHGALMAEFSETRPPRRRQEEAEAG